MLLPYYQEGLTEAGCDEAGRGCLAGPVVAAAVIFPQNYANEHLNDSKIIGRGKREDLKHQIESDALAYGVGIVSNDDIDILNILKASFRAMHLALDTLELNFDLILVDGNRFIPYKNVPEKCIIKGDGKYMSIAAASILAKTCRDEIMRKLHIEHPEYGWNQNMGYPTRSHRDAIRQYGPTIHHRRSFRLLPGQLNLFDEK